ncbi:DNA polymerase III subunit gamma/tau [bacterium]|nr:DNA polymerase III subunit gamma/tau [bacterium]
MATLSLFQKWRSQNFQDLVGQEVVVRTLSNALDRAQPANAYLFCGPRGTGKTSSARILAKALNCEKGISSHPCGECAICRSISEGNNLDVMEIDAASHTQVDKIREFIVEKVQFAPAICRYKIYIIDEVHKLSTASFNALLKTLEEPPAHVVFILATTHPQELLPTIISRCQRYDFRRFTLKQIVDRVKYVSERENCHIEDEAAELVAKAADGSLRDALVGLEQAITFCGESIDTASVRELLGLAGLEAILNLINSLISQDICRALNILDELVQDGRDLRRLTNEILEYLRQVMLVSVKAADSETFGVSDNYFQQLEDVAQKIKLNNIMDWIGVFSDLQRTLRDSSNARLNWEMALIKLTLPQVKTDTSSLESRISQLEAELLKLKSVRNVAPALSPVASVTVTAPPLPPVASVTVTAPPSPAVKKAEPQPVKAPAPVVEDLGWDDPPEKKAVASKPSSFDTPIIKAGKESIKQEDLGWGTESSFTPIVREESPKKKKNSPAQIWQFILNCLKGKDPDLYSCVESAKCLSSVRSVITIRFSAADRENYSKAISQKDRLVELGREFMHVNKLDFQLTIEETQKREIDPEDRFKHTVELLCNTFEGKKVAEYDN